MNEITICDTALGIKEYNGQRVVTLKDIDIVHQRPEGTASRNFINNRQHFIENTDYFLKIKRQGKKTLLWRLCCIIQYESEVG